MTAALDPKSEREVVDPRFAGIDCVFFVIGAQKAGTTWLSHYLKAHPNVSVPEWKEHDYWNMVEGRAQPSRMLQEQRSRRQKGGVLRDLVAHLPFTLHAKRQRAITLALKATEAPFPPYSAYADVIFENQRSDTIAAGEICPEYATLNADTYAKMARLSPNVRFIFLMRDPVARCISGLRHTLRKSLGASNVTEADLAESFADIARGNKKRHVNMSRYDATIAALETHVSADAIHYAFFETLFDQAEVKRICDFLGLPFVPGKIDRKSNVAGKSAVRVSDEDRKLLARTLKPVYDFAQDRFGDAVPSKWRESAALC